MVSIIVPVYNAESYIKRCLDSIVNQTISALEIILVDDGSCDSSLEIIREYAACDNRIIIVSQENMGVAAARNTGLNHATGEFILYVDADDWIEHYTIEHLLDYIHEDVDVVYCASDNADIPENVQQVNQVQVETWNNERQVSEFILHKSMSGMLWNKLIRRKLTEGITFNENTGYGEDAEFLWQVLQKSQVMIVTNEILYHHVIEPNSISHLFYSDKKYSAIPMWEKINKDVQQNYPKLARTARVSLTSAAVYGMYEARKSDYDNQNHILHMRSIARKNILVFIKAKHVSVKFKLYAIAVCVGY